MQIVRTILWVLLFVALLAFSFFNWDTVEVTLWENLVLETKVPALVIISFLLGLVPMWAYHRSVKWSLSRRIRSLENAARSTALQQRHAPSSGEAKSDASAPSPRVDKPVESTAKPGDTLTPADDTSAAP
ncbi:MAG: hypothetical protein QNI87_05615 [Erythrobacter sp.]|uniref:hypothetical protein n=1 Tax=Erythrobacter sp. TaxID=1042 RepID=UPI00260B90DC|nr:hypothetical protein [Erythrobacter sp.]MDJ0977995.1 hypothetical protein [Erythrobacter sp.]